MWLVVGIGEDGKARDMRGVGVLLRKWEVDFLVSACVYIILGVHIV